MRVSLIAIFVFSTAGCSQTNFQAQQNTRVGTPIVSTVNGPALTEATPSEVRLVKKWNGKISNNLVSWDGKDLTIELMGGKVIKTFSELAKNDLIFQRKENNAAGCLVNYYFKPLALVGNLVAFESETGILCGAINTISWGYAMVELKDDNRFIFSKPTAEDARPPYELGDVYLSDMFSESDIFSSLLANERISKDIAELIKVGKLERAPEDLAGLGKLFDKFEYDFLDGKYYLGEQALQGFTIHHIEGNERMSVWVSLTPKLRAAQSLRDHLELVLPVPDKLKLALSKASSYEEGFVMKDAEKLVGTEFAKFEFDGKRKLMR